MTSTSGSGGQGGEQPTDPDRLVADIERTREDLAETLELLVDKVSPKRVAQRTSEKVSAKLQVGLESARHSAEHLKGVATEKVAAARNSAVAVEGAHAAPAGGSVALPPTGPVEVPEIGSGTARTPLLAALPRSGAGAGPVPPAYLAAGAVALLFLLLIRRRRR